MQEQDKTPDRILSEIRHRIELNDKEHAEAHKRGEEYNIFRILGGQYSELAHSAFIADLLNPEGSHALGPAPLRSLLKALGVTQWNDNDCDKAKVNVEVPVDGKNVDEWGRMDIVVEANDKIIIIENKIYAGDQPKQLSRYKEYAKNHFRDNHTLVYLTLDGHDASDSSAVDLHSGTDYIPVSYKDVIIDWIDNCINLAVQKPLVREVLIQYRNTITELTANNQNNVTRNNVFDYILQHGEILAPVFACEVNHPDKILIENYCKSDFFQYGLMNLMNELSKYAVSKDMTCDFGNVIEGGRYCAFCFRREGWSKTITFQFTQYYWKGCYYGVHSDVQAAPGEKMPHLNNPRDHFIYGDRFTGYKNWDVKGLITGEIKKSVIEAVELTLDAINNNPEKFPMA